MASVEKKVSKLGFIKKVFLSKPNMVMDVFVDKDGKYRWRLRGLNNEILASSEAYSSKSACMDTVMTVAYGHVGVIKISEK